MTEPVKLVLSVSIDGDDDRSPLQVADDLLDWLCTQDDIPVFSVDGLDLA